MKVANKKIIRRLSIAHMKSAKNRNIITILAIVLTTVLFSALFTAGMSMKEGFEQANFRQAGGWNHASFKNITQEQYDELKDDPLIKEKGDRMIVGMPNQEPFRKSHVEVSYCDADSARWMFCTPKEGRLPEEGTNEAATDVAVLKLLGVEPVIGNEFTMTFNVDGRETTETFTLCGYWEYDEAVVANHVLVPRSRAEEIFERLGTEGQDGMTTFHTMNLMLKNASHIEENLEEILERHGFQSEKTGEENYVGTGVNWGYVSAQMGQSMDSSIVLALAAAVLLIVFTGYLIINNIFRIAVANDVRFYGLLKTIGTTGRQIKRIILLQAGMLSLIGIPLGTVAGYFLGVVLSRTVVANITDAMDNVSSLNPLIFAGAAIFSLITVYLSSRRPCRMAAKVSPIEALRYTEGYQGRKKTRRARTGASIPKMAWANLGRSKSKTVISVISMSLAIVILDLTYVFTGGFDMDKYLRRMTQDFILADAGYFQVQSHTWGFGSNAKDAVVEEEAIDGIKRQGGVTGGRTYGTVSDMQELVTEEWARKKYGNYMHGLQGEDLDFYVSRMMEQVGDKRADEQTRLYGMEDFVLDKLTVLDGDIGKLKEEGNYIAAVYDTDDYDNVYADWHWAKVGDKVTMRYVEQYEYYDPRTGEAFPEGTDLSNVQWARRAKEYREEEYEVAATVVLPATLTYRRYGDDDFVIGAETFKKHTGTDAVMYYAFDCADDRKEAMEEYLREYTEGEGSAYEYESKMTYAEEFYGMKNTFLFVGAAVSFVIGLIGVLNFFNAILTGILTRKKEFAVLQSVGMTGKQLNRMLMIEGILFAGSSVAVTLLLIIALGPMIGNALESMFWFFVYHINIVPILVVAPFFLLLGWAVPFLSYRYVAKKSVVERLREAE